MNAQVRFLPKPIGELFAKPYFAVIHSNGECTMYLRVRDEWRPMRRR
jgi:hypothetical protein